VCCISVPSHPRLFQHRNNICQGVQIMKLHIRQFSSGYTYMLPLKNKVVHLLN
jgi:hypothetical protein